LYPYCAQNVYFCCKTEGRHTGTVFQSAVIIIWESYGRHNVDEYPYQNCKATFIIIALQAYHNDLLVNHAS